MRACLIGIIVCTHTCWQLQKTLGHLDIANIIPKKNRSRNKRGVGKNDPLIEGNYNAESILLQALQLL